MAVKFTEKAEKVLLAAGNEAKDREHEFVGTEHILHGLLEQADSIALQAMNRCELRPADLRDAVSETLQDVPGAGQRPAIPFTPHAKKCLELAGDEAVRWGHFFITTEHLLMGLIREEEGSAARLLVERGLDARKIEENILAILGEPQRAPERGEVPVLAIAEP